MSEQNKPEGNASKENHTNRTQGPSGRGRHHRRRPGPERDRDSESDRDHRDRDRDRDGQKRSATPPEGHRDRNREQRDHRDMRSQHNSSAGRSTQRRSGGGAASQQPQQPQQQHQQHSNASSSHRRRPQGTGAHHGPSRSPRDMQINEVVSKLIAMEMLHNQARTRYYEYYHRADPQKKLRLEREFYRTCDELRDFENSLTEAMKARLQVQRHSYRLDLTYSSNHQLDPQAKPLVEGVFEDPHETDAMKGRHKFGEDTEESVGSLEDYYQLKGTRKIDVPTVK